MNSIIEISEDDWQSLFRDWGEYFYRKNHNYVRRKILVIDLIYCLKCGADFLQDKIFFKSCAEKEMDNALK